MKKVVLICIVFTLIFISNYSAYCNNDKVLKKVEQLILKKKYASAYNSLIKAEAKTRNIDYFIKRQDILLKHSISTNQHRTFYIKDILAESEYQSFNVESKGYLKVEFDAVLLYDSLFKIYPNNCKLNKALGEYYFDAYIKYVDRWVLPIPELMQKIAIHNEFATMNNCATANNYYALGQVLINKKKYKESLYFFINAIQRDSTNSMYLYNLAYSYLFTKNNEKAIEYANKTLKHSENKFLNSDAYRLLGQAYIELKAYDKALNNFKLADQSDSSTNANKLSILNVYLKTNNSEWETLLNPIYESSKFDIQFYTLIERIFESNNAFNQLIGFYEKKYLENSNNDTLSGNLLYFTGRLYADTNQLKAKELYELSKERFEKIYDKDHNVFVVLKESIEALK